MLDNRILAVLVILGVIFAWYLIGDVALGGLLLLFGLKGKKRKQEYVDENSDISDYLINSAKDKQKEARKVDKEIENVMDSPVDYEKPIEEVVKNAKKDWID